MSQQCVRQELPRIDRETEVSKKFCLAGPFWMLGSQKGINHFGLLDMSAGGCGAARVSGG